MGAPKKPASKKKSYTVRVRVTKAERYEIARRAKNSGAKKEAVWIRDRLLGGD